MITKFRKNKKTKTNSIFFSIILFLIIFATVSFLIISNVRISQKRGELSLRIDTLKQEIQDLETEKQRLQAGIRETEEKEYLEKKIRDQGYKKSGEQVVVVKKQEQKNNDQASKTGFLEKILGKFTKD